MIAIPFPFLGLILETFNRYAYFNSKLSDILSDMRVSRELVDNLRRFPDLATLLCHDDLSMAYYSQFPNLLIIS